MSEVTNAWGFTRKDLEAHGVQLRVSVDFSWAESAPEELRKTLLEASHVLHTIAQKQIMLQLQMDQLTPTKTKDILFAQTKDGVLVLRDSGWE